MSRRISNEAHCCEFSWVTGTRFSPFHSKEPCLRKRVDPLLPEQRKHRVESQYNFRFANLYRVSVRHNPHTIG